MYPVFFIEITQNKNNKNKPKNSSFSSIQNCVQSLQKLIIFEMINDHCFMDSLDDIFPTYVTSPQYICLFDYIIKKEKT